ncbi:endolysin [Streptomyces phage Alone3]|nr:endolysin [Streptomyces phage Alone3]
MVAQGPQRYPGASSAYWYEGRFPGDRQEVNVVVLHTTEGTSLPGYEGGATAPNFTAVPDLKNKKLIWYQHFYVDTSSRALRNLSGGVQTNTNNVCQVELVGTCDPRTHSKWSSSSHIYWPQAPEWALKEVAKFLAWMNENHNVPLSGPTTWLAYPDSYGSNKSRMTFDQWDRFKGVCGHQHVPENDHGDPGSLDFAKVISFAKELLKGNEDDDKPSTDTVYEVKKGDTLFGIAQKYDVKVDELKKWNNLKSDEIHPGDKLKVKAPESKPTPPKVEYYAFPGAGFFKEGKKDARIAAMHKRLVAEGCNKYKSNTNTDVWGSGDEASYKAWQQKLGYKGDDADGIPGKVSWDKLKVPKS